MNKILIVLSLLALSAFATRVDAGELKSLWTSWKTYHGRDYTIAEEAARFAIFVENYKKVINFNAESDDVKLGLNKFADITPQEFKAIYASGYKNTGNIEKHDDGINYSLMTLPTSVDWRTKGAVTPVKNQGSCGSCWAFSATGALEASYFLKNNNLLSFSEQQLVDCVTADQGCNGGLPEDAFAYTAGTGIETESDYPYTAADGNCQYDKTKSYQANTNYTAVPPKSLDQMKAAIANQPVSVGIQANQLVFQFYNGGVIKRLCGDQLDHGVLVVGYDVIKGTEAYIVKNSWGAGWGNDGYVYISTDASANNGAGVCGILSEPSVPTL